MAPLLRRRLECFYCGCRSAQKSTPNLRQWQCETCEAVNHLDENGEITDPPAFDTPPAVRYAQAINRPASPVFTPPDETLFCSTCIKNQLLLTQSLASYLPPTTHPDYATFEASYPTYRENLEERYPQVCEECEPRVRERIQKTGYAAKTDHLRRMMERTRSTTVLQSRWDWRYIVVYAGALGWWASFTGQMLWDAMGAMVISRDGLREVDDTWSLTACLRKGIQEQTVNQSCANASQPLANLALVLGFVSIWWNPRLSSKIRGPRGRMFGLSEFYKLQFINMGIRTAALYLLRHNTISPLDQQFAKASHAIMFVFTFAISTLSYCAVRMDYTPRVIFPDSPEPLIDQGRNKTGGNSTQVQPKYPQSNGGSFSSQSQTFTQPFPINSLASPPELTQPSPYQPPTPPPEDYESDSMDWTPSQRSLRPTPTRPIQPTPIRIEPSPFHGRLPPAPISQAQQLRNPPNQPSFHKASSKKQENFFKNMTSRTASMDDEEHPQTHPNDSPASSSRLKIASPRFFPSDQDTDTGLESLFTAAFSLKDEPPEVRAAQKRHEERTRLQRSSDTGRGTWQRLTNISVLCLACWAWSAAPRSPRFALQLRFSALGIAAAVAGRGLLQALRMDKEFWRFSEIIVFALEFGSAVYFGSIVNSSRLHHELLMVNGVSWLLGWLVFHEVVTFIQEMRDASSRVSQSSTSQQAETHPSPDHQTLTVFTPQTEQSFLSTHQHPQPYGKNQRSVVLGEVPQPRVRQKPKRESLVPLGGLSSLSLGLGD